MGTLQLSFHGPFLYKFLAAEVEIYAPKCAGHAAGFFTAKNETPLTGRHRKGDTRRYRVTGPVFTPPTPLRPTQFFDPGDTILNAGKTAKPVFESSHFCLIVPRPQIVVPISFSEVEVIDNAANPLATPKGELAKRACGLRFFFDADLSKELVLTLNNLGAVVLKSDFDAPALGYDFADAEIRYASATEEDQEHQDALECFESLATLAGVDWWLCYENSANLQGVQAFAKTGSDCRAPILIM
jgi:hypothetical protein